jgi:RimK family alpha-L-glutamate ligase
MRTIEIVAEHATETNLELAFEWRALGLDAEVFSLEEALASLLPGDVALARLDVKRSLDGVDADVRELLPLPLRGISLLNRPDALLAAHDKLVTARRLWKAGVPHPRIRHVRAGDPIPHVTFPAVAKPRFGSWGEDVFCCPDAVALRAVFAELESRPWFERDGALLQELIAPGDRDIRVLVAGGRVVGGEERIAPPGEWRTNVSLGARHWASVPPPAAGALAIDAAAAIGIDFCGVDVLPRRDGYVVVEINGAVDFSGEYALPGRNVFADIAAALGFQTRSLAGAPITASRSQGGKDVPLARL